MSSREIGSTEWWRELVASAHGFVEQHYEPGIDPDYNLMERLKTARSITCFPETERKKTWAALRLIRDAVGELFGPAASLESEEAVLHRGPEYHHEAEAIVDALNRVASLIRQLRDEIERLKEKAIVGEYMWTSAEMMEVVKRAEAAEAKRKDLASEAIAATTRYQDAENERDELEAEVSRLRARVEALSAALAPFADEDGNVGQVKVFEGRTDRAVKGGK